MGKNQSGILPILGEAFALYPYHWLKNMYLDSAGEWGSICYFGDITWKWIIFCHRRQYTFDSGSTSYLGKVQFNTTDFWGWVFPSLPRWAKRFWQQYERGSSSTEWTQSGVPPPLIPCASTKIPIPINTNTKTNV